MRRGQPSERDRNSAGRHRRPVGARLSERLSGGVALLMALSVPAVAALKAFDGPDPTASPGVRIIAAPPKPAQLLVAADRLERISTERRPADGTVIKAEAAPAAEAPEKSWTERARDAYERVVVPALSGAAAPAGSGAEQTAQTEPAQTVPAKPQAGDAVVPPVKREMPVTPPAQDQPAATSADAPKADAPKADAPAAPAAAANEPAPPETPSPASPGVMERVQDWLARSNRDYQGKIVKGLSSPSAAPAEAEDAIARKIEETKAAEAKKAAEEDAAKKAEAAKAADDAKTAAAEKQAADAKAREQKQIEDARKKAEETKRLADEASKKADEILKLEAEKSKTAAPAPPPPQKAETLKADDAERQRREAQRQADEKKRTDEARKAEEARQAEAERKAAEARAAAAARAAEDERRRAQAADAEKHRTRTVVLTPEPIVRPAATPTLGRPERLNGYRTTYVQDTQFRDAPVRQRIVIYSETRSGRVRGTAVKRWIWRTHSYSSRGCRYAGRRITPPARYTVARGDSLWRISEKHYNRGSKYRRIYRANRSLINDPDLIYPCQRFKIPRRR